MELNKKNLKAVEASIQKLEDIEEPNLTPEEVGKWLQKTILLHN